MAQDHNDSGRRWKSFSRTSLLVSAIVVAVPIVVSAAVAFTLSNLLPPPHTVQSEVLWWIGVLGPAGLTAIGAGRLSRRLLPLAALLNVSMLFPDKAPSRLAVLRKVGSTRNLDRQVQSGEVAPESDLNDAAIEILALATALGHHDRRTTATLSVSGHTPTSSPTKCDSPKPIVTGCVGRPCSTTSARCPSIPTS